MSIEPQLPQDQSVEQLRPSQPDRTSLDVALARARARLALFDVAERPRTIGRFPVLQALGQGGMGQVFAAYDAKLDRRIAIKVLHSASNAEQTEASRERLVTEARVMARLSHPNVVGVYEVDTIEIDGSSAVYVAMEFIDGLTLRQWLRECQPTAGEILDVFRAAGRGLEAVHRAGIVHRDFKPDNVMIDGQIRARVMDFGIARDDRRGRVAEIPSTKHGDAGGGSLTRTGAIMGTPSYMAPEQLRGEVVDGRADQWSFCVALWEALWGTRPFAGTNAQAIATAVLLASTAPEPPRTLVSASVRAAIRRGLSPKREDRFATMGALLDALAPARGSKKWFGGGVVFAGLVAAAAAGLGREPACPEDPGAFAVAWSQPAAQRLRSEFAATGAELSDDVAERVIEDLDRYARRWLEQRGAACRATRVEGIQSEARLDRRVRCLDRRRAEVTAVVAALNGPTNETILRAQDAVASVTDPQRCDDDGFLEGVAVVPDDPVRAGQIAELDSAIDRIHALSELGRGKEALVQLDELQPAVEQLDEAAVSARYFAQRGVVELADGNLERAKRVLDDGYFWARQSRLSDLAVSAALDLVTLHSGRRELGEAELWLRLARAEAGPPRPENSGFEISYRDRYRYLENARGNYTAALEHALEALQWVKQRDARDCPECGDVYEGIAHEYDQLGRLDEAVEFGRKAVAQQRARYGPRHPFTGAAQGYLGPPLLQLGLVDEAVAQLQESLAIAEASRPEQHFNLALPLLRYGQALQVAGRYDEAVAIARRAADIGEANGIDTVLWHAGLITCRALTELGRFDEALAALEKGRAALQRSAPDGHPDVAVAMQAEATIDLRRGEVARARELSQQALDLRRRLVQGDDPQRAVLLYGLAQALIELGRFDEAAPVLREGIALTRAGTLVRHGLQLRLLWVEASAPADFVEATLAYDDAWRRCGLLSASTAQRIGCAELSRVRFGRLRGGGDRRDGL